MVTSDHSISLQDIKQRIIWHCPTELWRTVHSHMQNHQLHSEAVLWNENIILISFEQACWWHPSPFCWWQNGYIVKRGSESTRENELQWRTVITNVLYFRGEQLFGLSGLDFHWAVSQWRHWEDYYPAKVAPVLRKKYHTASIYWPLPLRNLQISLSYSLFITKQFYCTLLYFLFASIRYLLMKYVNCCTSMSEIWFLCCITSCDDIKNV